MVIMSGRRPASDDLSRLKSFSGDREDISVRFCSSGNTSITSVLPTSPLRYRASAQGVAEYAQKIKRVAFHSRNKGLTCAEGHVDRFVPGPTDQMALIMRIVVLEPTHRSKPNGGALLMRTTTSWSSISAPSSCSSMR